MASEPQSAQPPAITGFGKWMALLAALLGWMFDGLEMGLFPLVARPALRDLMPNATEAVIGKWFAIAIAVFLIGAATGGVLFGWLGDRLGRVRAMMLSVMTYAIFTGLQGFVSEAWQIMPLRFIASLGMGGEWSLGVALVNEIWPGRSRAFMAGLIGAAANVGFLLIGVIGRFMASSRDAAGELLVSMGISAENSAWLVNDENEGWRLMMILGATPALLSFLIRLFVPESARWEKERERGTTSHWQFRDLAGVGIGALGAILIVYVWAVDDLHISLQVAGSLIGLVVVTAGYIYPVWRFMQRAASMLPGGQAAIGPTMKRMLFGAGLSGVALLGTWGSLQWAATWAHELDPSGTGRQDTQIWSGIGAIVGTIVAALLGDLLGRRITYFFLCIFSLASALFFFQYNTSVTTVFLVSVFIAGGFTAAFYGWLPLYLPEIFPTAMRATGQGFAFNFGRILAAVGALQTANIMRILSGNDPAGGAKYPIACSIMACIYVVGMVLIWFVPETKGQPLPD